MPRRDAEASLRSVERDLYSCRARYANDDGFKAALAQVTDFAAERRGVRSALGELSSARNVAFGPETWIKSRAAVHGVQYVHDDALGAFALVRGASKSFPHKQDCRSLGVGVRAQLALRLGNATGTTTIADAQRRHPLAGSILAWLHANGMQAHNPCRMLTYGNPTAAT